MKIVPFHIGRVAEGWKPVIGCTGAAGGPSMIGAINEHELFIGASGMVINDLTSDDEVVPRMLRDQKRNGDTFDIEWRTGVR